MSLQVWLPLNGDLHNQGLSNLTFINNTSNITIDNNGKIGKCYTRETVKTNGRIISNENILLDKDLSMCCWAKVTATVGDTANGLISNHNASTKKGFGITVKQISTDDYRICCSTGNGSSRTYHTYYGTTNIKDTWHHLALTYNHTKEQFQLWVDGKVEKTQSYTNNAEESKISIFNWNLSSDAANYHPACSLNDVRIYNHCLSDKEIEEIAKGLVLHYKLDEFNSNLLYTIPKSFNAAAYNAYQFAMTENLEANQTYTLQLWDVDIYHSVKTAAETGVWVYWGGGSVTLFNWAGPTYFTPQGTNNYHADYLVKTFTITSTQASGNGAANAWFNIYNSYPSANGTRNMHIGAWKLEKGSIATPWKDNADNNIIYDSSGYNNDGTISGTLTIDNNTPRNSYSMYTDSGINNYITTPNLYFNNEAITLNIWFKSTNTSPTGGYHMIVDSTVNRQWYEICINNTGFFRGGLFVNGARQAANCSSTTGLNGEWHMLTLLYDGNTVKRFFDGILESSTTVAINTGLSSPTALRIFKDGTSNSYACIEAFLSDFRIYATALTSEQILELYHISATIDNNGNIYSRELVEI